MFPRVYRLPGTAGRAGGCAEDVAQATLCQVVRRLETWRGEASLFTWVCTICRHEIDAWRRKHPDEASVELAEDAPEIRAALESLWALESGRTQTAVEQRELLARPACARSPSGALRQRARVEVSRRTAGPGHRLTARSQREGRGIAADPRPRRVPGRGRRDCTGPCPCAGPGAAGLERRRERHRQSHPPGRTATRASRVSRRARPGGGQGRVAPDLDRRSRWTVWRWALAAAALALAALWFRPTARPVAPRPPEVATVVRVDGSVRLASPPAAVRLLTTGDRLAAGAVADTTAGGRVALQLASGIALRVKEGTRIVVEAPSTVRLEQGTIYVDTTSGATAPGRMQVRTSQGTVYNLGTRFEVEAGPGAVRIRVRHGEVRVDRAGPEVRVIAGGAVTLLPDRVSSGGRHRRSGRTGRGSRPSRHRS